MPGCAEFWMFLKAFFVKDKNCTNEAGPSGVSRFDVSPRLFSGSQSGICQRVAGVPTIAYRCIDTMPCDLSMKCLKRRLQLSLRVASHAEIIAGKSLWPPLFLGVVDGTSRTCQVSIVNEYRPLEWCKI